MRHRLHLPPRDGHPVVLFLYGPCYEIAEEGGDLRYRWAPLPACFDTDFGLYVDLEALLVEMLGHHSVADCALDPGARPRGRDHPGQPRCLAP